jgi:hypothetical protein
MVGRPELICISSYPVFNTENSFSEADGRKASHHPTLYIIAQKEVHLGFYLQRLTVATPV